MAHLHAEWERWQIRTVSLDQISVGETMKAIGLPNETGAVELLQEFETPVPELGPKDILIKIEAVGMNPVDTMARGGFGNPGALEKPKIMGYDGAGVVAAKGKFYVWVLVRVWPGHAFLCLSLH